MEVMAAYEQVKVIEAEKRALLESASKEAEELKKLQSEIKCVEIDLLGQLEAFDKQILDNRRKKHHWEKELARLREVEEECDYDLDDDEQPEKTENDVVDMEVDGDQDAEEGDKEEGDESAEDMDESKSSSPLSLSHSVLEKYDIEEIKETISTLENERNMLAKNANMGAIAEYRKKEADYLSRCVVLFRPGNGELIGV
jgi:structural maintenance of chromosome 4